MGHLGIRKTRLSIFPEVREGGHLVQTGPFKLIRHPMYTAILLFFLPTQFHASSVFPVVFYGLLLINLLLKIQYEESLLKKHFTEYEQYQAKSFLLLPYIY